MSVSRPQESSSVRTTLVGAASIIFLGNVASRVLALFREQLAADRFGAGDPVAALTVSDNLNTLLFDLLASGMLHAALVPVLVGYACAHLATSEFRHVFGVLVVVAAVISGLVAVVGYLFAPQLVDLMTGVAELGDDRGAATTDLAVDLFRIIVPSLFFLTIATVLVAGLYAVQRPAGPALGLAFRNGSVVAAIMLFGNRIGIESMAYGILAGSVVFCGLQVLALWKSGALPTLSFDIRNPAIRQVAFLYAPVFVGLLVSSAVVVVDRNLAWGLEEDAIGAMRYATALVQLILGLVATAVSLAALPRMSAHFGSGDSDAFTREFSRAISLVTLLIVPAVIGMAVLSRPIVALLFEHGATDTDAARLITIALLAYLPGHLLAGYDQVMIFTFYSRQNTALPVAVGIVSAFAYFLAAWMLVGRFDMLGLVLANSVQLGIHTVLMVVLVRRWIAPNAFAGTVRVILVVTGCSMLMGVLAFALWLGLDQVVLTGDDVWNQLLLVGIPVIAGAAAYVFLIGRFGREIAALFTADIASIIDRLKPNLG